MAVWLVSWICPAPGLGAGRAVVATVANTGEMRALRGWIVWDANTGTDAKPVYRLMAWHAGRVIQLRARPRPLSFDLDLGTDLQGRVVAVFSRCAHYDPDVFDYGPMYQRGCRLRIYDLARQTERAAGEPAARGYSNMTPAIWRGRVAYQQFRVITGHRIPKSAVAQLWLWSPKTHRHVHLRHGRVGYHQGWATAMDLDDDLVAYVWDSLDQGGHSLELRVDTASGRSAQIARGGYGDAGGGLFPGPPNLVGRRVWFGYWSFDGVNVFHSWLDRAAGPRFKPRQATIHGHLIGYARDGARGYGLFMHGSEFDGCTSQAPCTIERVPDPPKL